MASIETFKRPTSVEKSEAANWGISQVGQWLVSIGLSRYVKTFAEHAVDGHLLLSLSETELRTNLEVTNDLHVLKLVKLISEKRSTEQQDTLEVVEEPSAPTITSADMNSDYSDYVQADTNTVPKLDVLLH